MPSGVHITQQQACLLSNKNNNMISKLNVAYKIHLYININNFKQCYFLGVTLLRYVKYLCFCPLHIPTQIIWIRIMSLFAIPKLIIYLNQWRTMKRSARSVGVTGAARAWRGVARRGASLRRCWWRVRQAEGGWGHPSHCRDKRTSRSGDGTLSSH